MPIATGGSGVCCRLRRNDFDGWDWNYCDVLDLMTGWRNQGKGLREIARELNRLSIRTPRGAVWYACTVKARLVTEEAA